MFYQSLHNVESVTAIRLYPGNTNSVTLRIVSDDVSVEMVLYFGDNAETARATFFALGGKTEDIV